MRDISAIVTEFADALWAQYPLKCLKVGVNAEWYNEPYVNLRDDAQGRESLNLFKESLVGISSRTFKSLPVCPTYAKSQSEHGMK